MAIPEMTPVSSSMVAAIGYDEKKQEAYVQFTNGAIYVYEKVTEAEFEELKSAESIGLYLSRSFKHVHPAARVS